MNTDPQGAAPPLAGLHADSSQITYWMADAADLDGVADLLATSRLPNADVAPLLQHFLVAKHHDAIVGTAGVQVCGCDALLRSVCVADAYRGMGLATRLCELTEAYARNLGVKQFYLLTTTAQEFFERRGFVTCPRDSTPASIRATAEFRSLCPASAVCMTRRLGEGAFHMPASLLPLRQDVPGAVMWAVGLKNTMLTYFEVEPHTRFELHVHEGEQITTVVAGELFFELNKSVVRVGLGDVIAVPAGVPHAVFTGDAGARAFDAWSPPPMRDPPAAR